MSRTSWTPRARSTRRSCSLARDIVSETGADYLHIVPGEGLYGLLSQVSGVPTTLFVDSQGKQVGTAYVGANDLDGWKTIADELLEGLEGVSRRLKNA